MSEVEAVLLLVGVPVVVLILVVGFVYAPGSSAPTRSRYITWLSPGRVAVVGTAVVVLLLALPISARSGDHEPRYCGNALRLNLKPPLDHADARAAWEGAYRSCNSTRIDRIALAVGVESVTLLITILMIARLQRRVA